MRFVKKKVTPRDLHQIVSKGSVDKVAKLLFNSILQNENFAFSTNSWSDYANKIDKRIKSVKSKKRFWNNLEMVIRKAEKKHKSEIHKGVIYWKKAILNFWDGDEYTHITSLLRKARKQDQEYQKLLLREEGLPYSKENLEELSSHRAQKDSAHKLVSYLEIIIDEVAKKYTANKGELGDVQKLISDKRNRIKINKVLGEAFDLHLESSNWKKLTFKPFDMLLGRNPYRALINSFYEGAGWITDQRKKMQSGNLEGYGSTYAVLVLSGTLIEGILLDLPRVRKRIEKIKEKNRTLGVVLDAYLAEYKKRLSPEIAVLLRAIHYSRNLIHPGSTKELDPRINIDFAAFIYRLAERCVILLAVRHKRKNPYKALEKAQI